MNESEKDALDALIVKNIAQVNILTSRLLYSIHPQVLKAMDAAVKEWVEAAGWTGKGKFKTTEEEWPSFAPQDWVVLRAEKSSDYAAYFQLEVQAIDKDTEGADQDWLVSLLGAGVGSAGIYITRGEAVNKLVWRRLLTNSEMVASLVALGFVYDDKRAPTFCGYRLRRRRLRTVSSRGTCLIFLLLSRRRWQTSRRLLWRCGPLSANYDRWALEGRPSRRSSTATERSNTNNVAFTGVLKSTMKEGPGRGMGARWDRARRGRTGSAATSQHYPWAIRRMR
jgi:hypothetical protein